MKLLAALSRILKIRRKLGIVRLPSPAVEAKPKPGSEGGRVAECIPSYFDEAFYRAQIPNEEAGTLTPWQHYRQRGEAAGLRPTALFDPRYYGTLRPDVVAAGVNLLEHFADWGVHEGSVPVDVRSAGVVETARAKLASNEDDRLARLIVATDAFEREKYEEALELVRGGRARGVAEQLIETRGLYLLGRYAEAMTTLSSMDEAVLRYAPSFTRTMLEEIGHAASTTGDYATAIAAYEEVQRISVVQVEYLPEILRALCIAYVNELCGNGEWQKGVAIKRDYERQGVIEPTLEVAIVSVERNAHLSGDPYREFMPRRAITPPALVFRGEAGGVSAERGELIAAPQYYSEIHDCLAFAEANAILQDDRVIYDLASHPCSAGAILGDRTTRDRGPLFRIRAAGRAFVEAPDAPDQTHEAGLMMFGVASSNYGHWFLEYLPRMLAFERAGIDADVPLFVNEGMPASHLESMQLLNAGKRRVMFVPKGATLRFARLGVAPVPAYFPLDTEGGTYDTVWPADIFGALKEAIEQSVGVDRHPVGARLFISRKSFAQRKLLNEEAIEQQLVRLGFEVIYPELLSFTEQVRKFSSARIVVGSCSSALTNCIFCPAGTVVLGLIHDYAAFNFHGYASFLMAGGVQIRFVRGKSLPLKAMEHPFHANYVIDMEHLHSALHEAGVV